MDVETSAAFDELAGLEGRMVEVENGLESLDRRFYAQDYRIETFETSCVAFGASSKSNPHSCGGRSTR
jgi:hypothetical protein